MICGVVGGLGSGKSLFLAYCLWMAHQAGAATAANFPVRGAKLLNNRAELVNFRSGLVALDELSGMLDSRNFADKNQQDLTRWIMLTRKYGLDLIYAVQSFDMVDNRLRQVTDRLILARGGQKKKSSKYIVFDMFDGRMLKTFSLTHTPALYALFNTYETDSFVLTASGSSTIHDRLIDPPPAGGGSGTDSTSGRRPTRRPGGSSSTVVS